MPTGLPTLIVYFLFGLCLHILKAASLCMHMKYNGNMPRVENIYNTIISMYTTKDSQNGIYTCTMHSPKYLSWTNTCSKSSIFPSLCNETCYNTMSVYTTKDSQNGICTCTMHSLSWTNTCSKSSIFPL